MFSHEIVNSTYFQVYELFCEWVRSSSAIVGARLMPDQKAKIVEVANDANIRTMYIGDGSNDVLAIQTAHVGVGIKGLLSFGSSSSLFSHVSGTDGSLAAMKSDFSVQYFSDLVSLLFILGRKTYLQCSLVSNYIFYKCACVTWGLLWWSSLQGFDGTSLFNGGLFSITSCPFSHSFLLLYLFNMFLESHSIGTLVGFNLLWTAPLILVFSSTFTYQIDAKKSLLRDGIYLHAFSYIFLSHLLDPAYYSYGQKGSAHNHYNSFLWSLNGMVHSFIVVFGLKYALPDCITSFSVVTAFTLAVVINLRLFFHETDNKNYVANFLTIGATLLYPLYIHYVEGLFVPFMLEIHLWILPFIVIVIFCFLVTNIVIRFLRRPSLLNDTLKYSPKTKEFKIDLSCRSTSDV
jgi:magnesium-transporting ATPase (P-type)